MKGKSAAKGGRIEVLRIDDLVESPVHIHTHSRKQTAHVTEDVARNGTGRTVDVAILGKRMYIIDGHLVVEAQRKNGKTTVTSRVHRARSEQEVVAMHVRHNMSNPPNPVQLLQAVVYMRKRKDTDEEIARQLRMNRFSSKILQFVVNEEALGVLAGMIEDVADVYYSAHHAFPMPLLEWVFRQHVDMQRSAAIALREIVKESCSGSEHRFVWPTMMEARIRQNYSKVDTSADEGPLSVTLVTPSDGFRGRPPGRSVKDRSEGAMGEIGRSQSAAQRNLTFQCPHGETLYVDTKSRVYQVEPDRDGLSHMRRIDVEGGVYQVPEGARRFMRARGGTIYIKECSPSDLARLVPELKKRKLNVCVLSSEQL